MSSDPYCPEVDNASDTSDSDFNVESISSEDSEVSMEINDTEGNEEKMDCGQCFDCEMNPDCIAKEDELKKKKDIIDKMIKDEVDKVAQPAKNLKQTDSYKKLEKEMKKEVSDEDKINAFGKFIWENGGIDVNNIIEFKQLVILIGSTEQMKGYENFPRDSCYKLLEMMTYHTNKHLEILNV